MCGLVGIAGDTSYKWKDIFTDLLIIDSLRGPHSTGMALVERHKAASVKLVKAPGNPFNLIDMPEYRTTLTNPARALIGHNRFATIGGKTVENAHPFEFKHVVGAHNGTLDKWSIKYLHEFEKFDTDSQAIFSHINKYNIRAAVDQMSGAWALTWYDDRDNTINFLRNSKRPLYYAYSHDRTTLIWASEREMLDFVIARNNVKIDDDKVYLVEPDTHFKWVIPDFIMGKFGAPVRTEMKHVEKWNGTINDVYEEYDFWNRKSNHHQGQNSYTVVNPVNQTKITDANVVPFKPNEDTKKKIDTKKFRPPYKDVFGKVFGRKEFNRLVSNGCTFCGDCMSEWGDFIAPLGDDVAGRPMFLCENCYNDDDIRATCEMILLEA